MAASELKILCTADVHIHDYHAHAHYDRRGIPDRLKAFTTLAKDLKALADKSGCQMIVVAGDLLQSSTVRPMVANTAKRFLKILTEDNLRPVVVVPGQHDMDTKVNVYDGIHSIIEGVRPAKRGLHYCSAPELLRFPELGLTVFAQPWTPGKPDYSKMEPADLFVGHGMVSGSTDASGFVFDYPTSFRAPELFKRYQLSVIGDIHHRQTFKENNRAVLVPGTPIQHTFKDDPVCGVWIVTLRKSAAPALEFVPITSIRDDGTYHRFVTLAAGERPPEGKNIHVRASRSNIETEVSEEYVDAVKAIGGDIDLLAIVKSQIEKDREIESELRKQALEVVSAAYEKADFRERAPVAPRQRIISISVDNFMSVDKFSMNFKEIQSDLLIVGRNGSGKTTIPEAYYYALTGDTTKGVPVNELVNRMNRSAGFSVKLVLRIGKRRYRIERGRSGGKPFLRLFRLPKVKGGKSVQLDNGPDLQSTQERILQLLGLSKDDILSLSYFCSQDSDKITFSSMSGATKNDLLGRLVGMDRLDVLREAVSAINSEREHAKNVIEVRVTEASTAIQTETRMFDRLTADLKSKTTEQPSGLDFLAEPVFADLKSSCAGLEDSELDEVLEESLSDSDAEAQKLEGSENELTSLRDDLSQLDSDIRSRQSGLQNLDDVLGSAKAGLAKAENKVCHTCGQPLKNDSVARDLKSKIEKAETQKSGLESDLRKLNDRRAKLLGKISDLSEQVKTLGPLRKRSKKLRDALDFRRRQRKASGIDDLRTRIRVSEERIAELKTREVAHQEELKSATVAASASSVLIRRILTRSGPVVTELNKVSLDILVKELNSLIGNPEVFKAEAVYGKDPDIRVSFNSDPPGLYGSMSGGERTMTDILMMLSLNNVFSRRYRLEHGIMGLAIFDEVFVLLDERYMDLIRTALDNCLSRNRIVITHDTRLQSYFDQVLYVSRKPKASSQYELRV